MTNDLVSFKELTALQRRWVMMLTQSLMNRELLARSAALKKAWFSLQLLDALGKGYVEFGYYKEDGTLRNAVGTLCRGVCKGFDEYKGKGGKNPRDNSNTDGIYTYWDIERGGFRSFRSVSLAYMK